MHEKKGILLNNKINSITLPTFITIRAGSKSKEDGGEELMVTQKLTHEFYKKGYPDHDAAVLKVHKPFDVENYPIRVSTA